jgi:hypothetical protein
LTKGVADFEAHCVQEGWEVSWEVLAALKANPEDLSVIPDLKHRMMADALQQQALYEMWKEVGGLVCRGAG